MIGRLRGQLVSRHPPRILLDVNGVGYEIEAPMTTFYQLPANGENLILHTHMVVREDAQLLFGFYTENERHLFRTLIRINGVGPKLALTILSGVSTDEFTRCIIENDAKSLTALPGVGKKTAERLIVELRDRLGDDFNKVLPGAASLATLKTQASSPVGDAVSALISLGYKAHDASRMVRSVACEGLEAEAIIKAALQATVRS